MNTHATIDFRQRRLSTRTEVDPDRRRVTIEKVWSPEGILMIPPLGARL